MKTKFLVRFMNRIAHLDADIELVDVIKINIAQGTMHSGESTHLFENVNPTQHPRLAGRQNSASGRKMAINHLKSTLYGSYIKDIYEELTHYIQSALIAAAHNKLNPDRLIGEHKVQFEANEILAAGSWTKVVELISKNVYRKLENEKTTKGLIQKFNAKLNLGVNQATIDAALPFFEVRHLLVHADGKADSAFVQAYPQFNATVGSQLQLDFQKIQEARVAITKLITEIDQQIVSNSIVASSHLQP